MAVRWTRLHYSGAPDYQQCLKDDNTGDLAMTADSNVVTATKDWFARGDVAAGRYVSVPGAGAPKTITPAWPSDPTIFPAYTMPTNHVSKIKEFIDTKTVKVAENAVTTIANSPGGVGIDNGVILKSALGKNPGKYITFNYQKSAKYFFVTPVTITAGCGIFGESNTASKLFMAKDDGYLFDVQCQDAVEIRNFDISRPVGPQVNYLTTTRLAAAKGDPVGFPIPGPRLGIPTGGAFIRFDGLIDETLGYCKNIDASNFRSRVFDCHFQNGWIGVLIENMWLGVIAYNDFIDSEKANVYVRSRIYGDAAIGRVNSNYFTSQRKGNPILKLEYGVDEKSASDRQICAKVYVEGGMGNYYDNTYFQSSAGEVEYAPDDGRGHEWIRDTGKKIIGSHYSLAHMLRSGVIGAGSIPDAAFFTSNLWIRHEAMDQDITAGLGFKSQPASGAGHYSSTVSLINVESCQINGTILGKNMVACVDFDDQGGNHFTQVNFTGHNFSIRGSSVGFDLRGGSFVRLDSNAIGGQVGITVQNKIAFTRGILSIVDSTTGGFVDPDAGGSSPAFTAADVGKELWFYGAGVGGSMFRAVFAEYINGSSFKIVPAPPAGIVGGRGVYGVTTTGIRSLTTQHLTLGTNTIRGCDLEYDYDPGSVLLVPLTIGSPVEFNAGSIAINSVFGDPRTTGPDTRFYAPYATFGYLGQPPLWFHGCGNSWSDGGRYDYTIYGPYDFRVVNSQLGSASFAVKQYPPGSIHGIADYFLPGIAPPSTYPSTLVRADPVTGKLRAGTSPEDIYIDSLIASPGSLRGDIRIKSPFAVDGYMGNLGGIFAESFDSDNSTFGFDAELNVPVGTCHVTGNLNTTTLTTAVGVGGGTAALDSVTNLKAPMRLTVDTGANQEVVLLPSTYTPGTNPVPLGSYFTKPHAAGVAVTYFGGAGSTDVVNTGPDSFIGIDTANFKITDIYGYSKVYAVASITDKDHLVLATGFDGETSITAIWSSSANFIARSAYPALFRKILDPVTNRGEIGIFFDHAGVANNQIYSPTRRFRFTDLGSFFASGDINAAGALISTVLDINGANGTDFHGVNIGSASKDNNWLGFDAKYDSGWKAYDAAPFIFYKQGGVLGIYSNSGLAGGGALFSPILRTTFHPDGSITLTALLTGTTANFGGLLTASGGILANGLQLSGVSAAGVAKSDSSGHISIGDIAIANVTGLQSQLDAINSALAGKANHPHTHPFSYIQPASGGVTATTSTGNDTT